MMPTDFAQLRAAGFVTGVRRYPELTFHYARGRVGPCVVGVVHAAGHDRGFVAFENTVTGLAGYITEQPGRLVVTARAAIADLAAGRSLPVGFNGRTRPLQVRFPKG